MMSEDEESDIERICSEFKLAKPNNISHMSLDFTQNSIIKTNDSKIPEGVPDYMKNLHKPTIVPVQWEVRYE